MRPSLLVVTLSLAVGGTERHIAQIMPELKRRGFDITIYCTATEGILAETLRQAGIDVVAAQGSGTSAMGRLLAAPSAMLGLAREIRRRRPGVIHFFLPGPYLIGAPVAIASRVPVRVMSRRGRNTHHKKFPGARRAEEVLHRRMTAVLGNSRRVVDDLLDEGCARDCIGLIYNGTDLSAFERPVDRAAIRASVGVPEDAILLIKVANLIPYKGHSDLLKALAAAIPNVGRPLVLALAGRDDGIGATLAAEARALGIESSVRFLGMRRDIPDLLQAADIGVLASHEEGFSNAVIEGMAAGLPMLVTDVGGNAEAVVYGVTGFVVPPHAPKPMADAIVRLASDADLRRCLGDAGRRRANDLYALTACVDRYEALYCGLAAGRLPGEIAGLSTDASAT